MMLSLLLAAAATVTAPVPSMPHDWWSDHYDWPRKGLAPGELSVVVAEITVNKRGYMEGCVGRVFAGNPKMGPYVCSRLKMRAAFKPARGPDDSKVIGIYRKLIVTSATKVTTFRARRFGIRVPGGAQGDSNNPFEIQFYLDAKGQISHCSLIEAVGLNLLRHKQVVEPALVQRACAEIQGQLKPVPPLDKKGNPIPTVQNALVITDGPFDHNNMK